MVIDTYTYSMTLVGWISNSAAHEVYKVYICYFTFITLGLESKITVICDGYRNSFCYFGYLNFYM